MTDETAHIVCPHCDAINRAPRAKLSTEDPEKWGKCGKCGSLLFESHPLALDARRFARHASKSDIPLLVDFWAAWCGPCLTMAPMFEAAAKQLEPTVRLAKIDTEANQALAAQYNIRSIPTLAMFKGGKEIARVSGVMDTASLVQWARQYL